MNRIGTVSVWAVLGLFVVASPAAAQRSAWGLSASMTPVLRTEPVMKVLFAADEVALEGSEFRIGVVRGRTYRGDWGLSFVRTKLKEGGIIESENGRDVFEDQVVLTGATIDKFSVITTIKDRVQIGVISGIGVATVKGTARRDDEETVEARDVLRPLGIDAGVSPLARLELALAVILAEGFKVRASAGFTYPGLTRFSVGGVILFDR